MLLILCVMHRFSFFNFKRLFYVCSVALWFCIVVNHLSVTNVAELFRNVNHFSVTISMPPVLKHQDVNHFSMKILFAQEPMEKQDVDHLSVKILSSQTEHRAKSLSQISVFNITRNVALETFFLCKREFFNSVGIFLHFFLPNFCFTFILLSNNPT